MRFLFIIAFVCIIITSYGQTLGGDAVYNFLKLPASPLLSATGGVNVSYNPDDAGLATNQPALLNERMDGKLGLSFNAFFSGIKAYQLTGAMHEEKWKTTIGGSVFFVDYGTIPQTDAIGNQNGDFRPKEFVIQLSAARTYLEKWQYGITAKYISSDFGQYKSSAIAFDAGVMFNDSSNLVSAGFLAKNMGAQLSTYAGQREDLPFDLQLGFTKRLAKAPFGFSLTAQQVHTFDILYRDTTFNNENNYSTEDGFVNKLFNHFVLATHIYIGRNLEVALGYNRLRRSELNLGASGNGLNGVSAGFVARFNKLEVQYARSYYQRNHAYNQLGISINLKQLVSPNAL